MVALGDSISCGEGVGVRIAVPQTWPALLAAALPDGRLVPLAAPGARVRDVRYRQLGSIPQQLDLVTLVVGLNDVVRPEFDAHTIRTDLLATVRHLTGRGATVLLGRLHDPTTQLPLPPRLARSTRQRVGAVNAAVDVAGRVPRVHLLDLAEAPSLQGPSGWAVDRIHPSELGHQGIAAHAAGLLADAGWRLLPLPEPLPTTAPSTPQRAVWLIRHGVPYALRHVPQLGRPALSALLGHT